MADDASRSSPPRRRRWLLAVPLVVLALLLALAGGAWWTWRSDAGFAWLLRQVPGLEVTGPSGRPDGGPFAAQQLTWQSGDLRVRVEGLSWRDLDWRWRPYPGAWLRIELVEPRAERVHVTTGPPKEPAEPRAPPQSLRLPLELVVRGLAVGALQIDEQPPVRALRGDLHLGDEAGRVHRLGPLAARRDPVQASVEARIGADAPMELAGRIQAGTLEGAAFPWQADVRLAGPLARLGAQGTLAARGEARLGVQATLTPFERWPVGALQASAEALDLSALADTLPATRLSGRVVVRSTARDAPVSADIDLVNAAPGPWDAGRLPLRRLRATVTGGLAQPDTLDFAVREAVLEGAREAGLARGEGRWHGTALAMQWTLEAVQPARLDGRLAPMTLGGAVRVELQGLPSPDPAAPPARTTPPLTGALHATLTGRLDRGPARPLRIAADVAFTLPPDRTLHAQIERLQLASGAAEATLTADVRRDAQQAWHVRSEGALHRFDPSDWWAGPGGAAWARGPHALNGAWTADVALPAAAAGGDLRATLRALRGEASVRLDPSRLAGVPVRGTASVEALARATALDADLQAAGNRAAAQWRLGADPAADRWTLDVDAPALAALAPLGRLAPGAEAWLPRAGTLKANGVAEGTWPALRTEGELHASGVEAGAIRAGRLDARWTATPARVDAPLVLELDAAGLAHGEQRLETLQAQLSGTLRAHRLQLAATSPLRPPEWTDAVVSGGAAPPRGSALRLSASGEWTPAAAGGGTWRGRVAELRATGEPAGTTPFVEAHDVDAEARLGPQGQLVQAALLPGRLQLLGAALQWREARFEGARAAGAPPRIALDASLEPLAVAPWLARLQPHFGWGGDLRVGGTFRVASGDGFDADIVLERAGGDLAVSDETGRRALGLTDLRIGLAAHGGTWHFTEAMAGTYVGVLSGAQSVRTAPGAAWPSPDDPLQGVLELRVADLGPLSAWLPPGWRLDGQLHTTAAAAGRFGAPEVSGRITGAKLGVRNLLEGIQLRDGTLAVALAGREARIERFVFRGGDGELRVEGGASLGEAPGARVRVVAEDFQALGRLDRRLVVSGQANVALAADRLAVDGRFDVDQGRIDVSYADAPKLDEDVVVVNRPNGRTPSRRPVPAAERDAPAAPASPFRSTDVSLVVDLGEDLRLVGRGLDAELRGQLRITTPGGELQVHGTVRIVEGTYTAYGQNLAIERGTIVFNGDLASPRLDILAVRPDIDMRVGVAVLGPAAQPRVRLYSEPEMSEMDKLSWLVLGRASEGLGRADTALLQRAALALLAGERTGDSPGIVQRLGLDELSLRRGEDGELAGTVVSLGKQISKRWYVGYERGLNAAAGSWQLIYRVARRLTVRMQTGAESALDVVWTWRWD